MKHTVLIFIFLVGFFSIEVQSYTCCTTFTPNTNLIENGQFETPDLPSTEQAVFYPPPEVLPWVVTLAPEQDPEACTEIGIAEIQLIAAIATDGQYMELDSECNTQWSQTVCTAPRASCTVSFIAAARPAPVPASYGFKVLWNDVTLGNYPTTSNAIQRSVWTPFSFSVLGTGQDTLTFIGFDDSDTFGALIDQVSVVCTPPPPITAPPDVVLECPTTASSVTTPASITSGTGYVVYSSDTVAQTGCGNTMIVSRNFVFADCCGLSNTDAQLITIKDTTSPEFDSYPKSIVVCESQWPKLKDHLPTATDTCSLKVRVKKSDKHVVKTPNLSVIKRHLTAIDECDNHESDFQYINVIAVSDSICENHKCYSLIGPESYSDAKFICEFMGLKLAKYPFKTNFNIENSQMFNDVEIYVDRNKDTKKGCTTIKLQENNQFKEDLVPCTEKKHFICEGDRPPCKKIITRTSKQQKNLINRFHK